jgi:hypothetical protein
MPETSADDEPPAETSTDDEPPAETSTDQEPPADTAGDRIAALEERVTALEQLAQGDQETES